MCCGVTQALAQWMRIVGAEHPGITGRFLAADDATVEWST
jgi:hypothetical protein